MVEQPGTIQTFGHFRHSFSKLVVPWWKGARLPVVRDHLLSDFLPSELVSVSQLEAQRLTQTTHAARAVTPVNSEHMDDDAYRTEWFSMLTHVAS